MSRDRWFAAATEKNVMGRFEYYDQLDIMASKAADEKKYKQIIVCRTKVAGDQDENVLPVRDHNRAWLINRFPDAWKSFQGEVVEHKGTPLTELGMSEERVMAFQINAVYSVEQVAELSDAQCEKVGFGTRTLRQKAQELMAKRAADAAAVVAKAAQAIVDREADDLQGIADALSTSLKSEKRKPGRPKKVTAEAAA